MMASHARRASWLASDREEWLARNQPYAGVKETLQFCEYPFYVASSKAAHR